MKFLLIAILVAGCLYGIGYYPAVSYDSPHGPLSIAYGIGLAFILIVPGYFVMEWARSRSQAAFLIAFGTGFLGRLILLVLLFFLYSKLIRAKDYSFGIALGVCYCILSVVEALSFKRAVLQNKNPRFPS